MPDINETLAKRGNTHGNFKESAVTVQTIKSLMRDAPNWDDLTCAQREALDMIQHKIGRILHGDPNCLDHWVDLQGYAKLGEPT